MEKDNMKVIVLDEIQYTLEKDYKNGYDLDAIQSLYTEYFHPYDYLFGDWSYGKLRLKGFYDKKNKQCRPVNDYRKLESYIQNQCAYECRYFVLKKIDSASEK